MYAPRSATDLIDYYRADYMRRHPAQYYGGGRTVYPWEQKGYNGPGILPAAADLPPSFTPAMPAKPTMLTAQQAATQSPYTVSASGTPVYAPATVPATTALPAPGVTTGGLPGTGGLRPTTATYQPPQTSVQNQPWYIAQQKRIREQDAARTARAYTNIMGELMRNMYAQYQFAPPEVNMPPTLQGYGNLKTYYNKLTYDYRKNKALEDEAYAAKRRALSESTVRQSTDTTGYVDEALENAIRQIQERYASLGRTGTQEEAQAIAEARLMAQRAKANVNPYRNPYNFYST